MSDDFSWADLGETDYVTQGVNQTAVYLNPRGEIAIRQEAGTFQDEDPVVVLPIPYAEKLILRLQAAIAESRGDEN